MKEIISTYVIKTNIMEHERNTIKIRINIKSKKLTDLDYPKLLSNYIGEYIKTKTKSPCCIKV